MWNKLFIQNSFSSFNFFFVSVYNWTVDDVIDWLSDYVDLPQYIHNFKVNAVDGRMLPRWVKYANVGGEGGFERIDKTRYIECPTLWEIFPVQTF